MRYYSLTHDYDGLYQVQETDERGQQDAFVLVSWYGYTVCFPRGNSLYLS
jgi:hypothetical protein